MAKVAIESKKQAANLPSPPLPSPASDSRSDKSSMSSPSFSTDRYNGFGVVVFVVRYFGLVGIVVNTGWFGSANNGSTFLVYEKFVK